MWQQQLELGEFPFPIIGIMRMGLKKWLKLGGKSGPTGIEEFSLTLKAHGFPATLRSHLPFLGFLTFAGFT